MDVYVAKQYHRNAKSQIIMLSIIAGAATSIIFVAGAR